MPLCLLFQFTKLSNLYFLVVATLQSIPAISPLAAKTAVIPLAVVILISMVREAIEDVMRARSDITQNNQRVTVLRDSELAETLDDLIDAWRDYASHALEVGNIVKVVDGDMIPADLVLLATKNKSGYI